MRKKHAFVGLQKKSKIRETYLTLNQVKGKENVSD